MKIFTNKRVLHRVLAMVMCSVMIVLACFQTSSVGAAQTEEAGGTEAPADTETPEKTEVSVEEPPEEMLQPAETEISAETDMSKDTVKESETPETTESPMETDNTLPVIHFPQATAEPEKDIPKGTERLDQHIEDKQYLLSKADRKLIGEGDNLLPVDIVYLTITMADRSCFDHDPTLKDLWQTDKDGNGYSDNAMAFVGQTSSYAVLYAPSVDSEYYAAKVDRATSEDMWVTDWGAANSRNGLGEDCDGVIYDKITGIVYIPKHFCKIPEKGPEGLGMVRFQLLYAVSNGDIMKADTSIELNVEGDTDAVSREVDVPVLLPNTTVTLTEGSEVKEVQVNGMKLEEDGYKYDNHTGELTVFQSAATIDNLDIEMAGKTVNRAAKIAVDQNKIDNAIASAVSSGRSVLPGVWEFSSKPKGTFEINGVCNVYYIDDGSGLSNYVNPSVDVYNNGHSQNNYTHSTQWESMSDFLALELFNGTWGTDGKYIEGYEGVSEWKGTDWASKFFYGAAMTRAANIPTASSASIANYEGCTLTKTAAADINLMCGHIITSGLSTGTPNDSDYHKCTGADLYFRVLGVSSTQNVAMVSCVSATVRDQVGTGIFFIRYQLSGGNIQVRKTAKGAYSLSGYYYNINGAKYGLFVNSTGTQRYDSAKYPDITVNGATSLTDTATAIWNLVPPGTYYVRETQASSGFLLDATIHKVTVTSGNTSYVDSEEPEKFGSIELIKSYDMLSKVGGLSGAEWILRVLKYGVIRYGEKYYSTNGAIYGLWTNSTCSGDPISTRTTEEHDGTDGYARWDDLPFGTYYIKEMTPSPGCKLDTSIHKVTLTEQDYDNNLMPISVTSVEPVPPGYILLYKEPEDPDAVKDNAYYSLDGAEFSLYADEDCTQLIETRTIVQMQDSFGEDPYSFAYFTIFGPLPIGTYYLKETKTPKGYTVDYPDTVKPREIQITSDMVMEEEDFPAVKTTWEEPEKRGLIRLYKESSDPDFTDGNPDYSFTGARYGLYRDKDCTDLVSTRTFNNGTGVDGTHFVVWTQLLLGKYYIKELEPPTCGLYEIDKKVYEVELTYDGQEYDKTMQELTSRENPVPGQIDLVKKSEVADITGDNELYDLSGAVYELFRDNKLTDSVGQRKTDRNGHVVWEHLSTGTYYAKEISPSPGFGLDKEIHSFKIDKNNIRHTAEADTVEITSYEPPKYDPGNLEISKIWDGKFVPSTPDMPSLEGTKFTIAFYADDYYDANHLPSSPTRTWILEVKKQTDASGLIKYITHLEDKYLTDKSDALFKDLNGDAVLPLGTYTIVEKQPAPGYTFMGDMRDKTDKSVFGLEDGELVDLSDRVYITYVKDESDDIRLSGGNQFTVRDKEKPINITVIKKDTKGKPLSGVKFQLTDEKGSAPVTKITDNNGYAEFTGLPPETYTITEVETVEGNTLLPEPIVIKAPMKLTPQEVKEYNIDVDKVTYVRSEDMYYIYDFAYEVTNGAIFRMPQAGVLITGKRFLPLAIGMASLVMIAGLVYPMIMEKRRKRKK